MDTKELLKKVRKIEIKTKRLSNHIFSGEYHSSFKGRGMTFSEVRQYQYGDDIRNIDWNVTARYNEAHVKVFEEERELTMMLMVDISGSEGFGSKSQFKKDIVTEIAATMAFSATQNNDKIGLILFSDNVELYIPPKKGRSHVLRIIRELIERIACLARSDRRIDNKSGVSQRLPISVLEPGVSNAERRALFNGERRATPRINDVYAALPSITGKIELEYEGEQVGAARIARELIRKAAHEIFGESYAGVDMREVLDHFKDKTELLVGELSSDEETLNRLRGVNGLTEAAMAGRGDESESNGSLIVACELILEGLHANKKLERKEARGAASYGKAESPKRPAYYDDFTGGKLN